MLIKNFTWYYMNNTRTLTEFNITWTQHACACHVLYWQYSQFSFHMLQQYSLTANEAPQGRLSHFGALAICGTIVFSTLGTAWAGATLSNPPKESAICKKTKLIIHEYPKTVKTKHTDIAYLWCTKWENLNITIMCSVFMLILNFYAPSKCQPNSHSKPWCTEIVQKELTGWSTDNWPMCVPFPIVTFEQANIAGFSCIISVRQQDQPDFDMIQQPNQLPVTAKKLNPIVTWTKFDRLKDIKWNDVGTTPLSP